MSVKFRPRVQIQELVKNKKKYNSIKKKHLEKSIKLLKKIDKIIKTRETKENRRTPVKNQKEKSIKNERKIIHIKEKQ